MSCLCPIFVSEYPQEDGSMWLFPVSAHGENFILNSCVLWCIVPKQKLALQLLFDPEGGSNKFPLNVCSLLLDY
jgi:hypothetical protein